VVFDLVHVGVRPPFAEVAVPSLRTDHDVDIWATGDELLGEPAGPRHVDVADTGAVRGVEQRPVGACRSSTPAAVRGCDRVRS